jgi:hypothetical protein
VLLLGTTTSTGITVNNPVTVTNVGLAMAALKDVDNLESELSLALADAINGGAELVEVMKIETVDGILYTGYSTLDRFIALSGAYDALAAHDTDIIVPVGAYAEDPIGEEFNWVNEIGAHMGGQVYTGGVFQGDNSFLRQLAQFCYDQTREHNTTLGVIGVKPPLLAPVNGAAYSVLSTGAEGHAGAGTSAYGVTGLFPNAASDTGYYFGTPSKTVIDNWVDGYLLKTTTSGTNADWKAFLSGSNDVANAVTNAYLIPAAFQATEDGVGVTDDLGNKVDLGAYVSVIAAPMRTLGANVSKFAIERGAAGSNLSFNTDGAAAYAGMISSLSPQRGTTNKPLPGIVSSRRVSRSQATALVDSRMVTMIERSRGFVVAKGVTGAYHVDDYNKSDFTQLTTVRITHAAIDQVRLAAEGYIGEPINNATQNAMRQAIEGGLRSMQLAGAINRFDFALIATPNQVVLGQTTIELTIVPAFELLSVTVQVRLAKE